MESSSPAYDYDVATLQTLMELRGSEAVKRIENDFGGIERIGRSLRTDLERGLASDDEADIHERRNVFGWNIIPTKKPKTFLQLAWEALHDVTLIILVGASIISLGIGIGFEENKQTAWIDGFAIMVAVVIVVIVAAANDYSKEKQFQALQKQIKQDHNFNVIRGGNVFSVNVTEIVVGDVISFKYGDALPADGILIEGNDIRVDESSMTGENDHVKKRPGRDIVLLSSTQVMEGSGKMLVCAVGVNSQSGVIFTLMNRDKGKKKKEEKEERPSQSDEEEDMGVSSEKSVLQRKLTKLAIQIGYFGLTAAILSAVVLILRYCIETYVVNGEDFETRDLNDILHGFIIGVTVLVVALPEGLPLAVTISLAYSVKKMMRDHNLVRHLYACETMGNATAICSDKTGTLTTNRMTVVRSYVGRKAYGPKVGRGDMSDGVMRILCDGIAINSGYSSCILAPEREGELPRQAGNKTECALLQFCDLLGESYKGIRDRHPERSFTKVFTFNSIRKSMTTVIPLGDGKYRVFTKGASEILINKCSYILGSDAELHPLSRVDRKNLIRNTVETMAEQGLRTLTLAYKDVVEEEIPQGSGEEGETGWDDEAFVTNDLVCVAVVGIEDPVRDEVPASIDKVQMAGVTVRMVTGDNEKTATAIASKCGILPPGSNFLVMTGREFNRRIRDENGNVKQELVDLIWPRLRVLARSSPEDKHLLVKGIMQSKLTKHQEVVAVTGDGTNDGPALSSADVGFAMGIAGTDVAKSASDIVLTDDNFASIVKAVMWGRNVYDSISKFVQFQLTVNVVAVILTFISSCVINESPLTALQMLWVNLLMDSMASLALATEPPTDELLQRKPYGRTKPLISRTMFRNIVMHSLFQLAVVFTLVFAGAHLFDIDSAVGQTKREPTQHFTIVFNAFVMMQIFNEINARKCHGERNVFKGITSNPTFIVIVVGTLAVQILIVEYCGLVFHTVPLTADQWLWCIFLGVAELLWGQVVATVPKNPMPSLVKDKVSPQDEIDTEERNPRILWMRGLWRLQAQIRVVNAFRASVETQPTPQTASRKSTNAANSPLYPSKLFRGLSQSGEEDHAGNAETIM